MNEGRLLEQYARLPESLEDVLAGLDEPGLDFNHGCGWSSASKCTIQHRI